MKRSPIHVQLLFFAWCAYFAGVRYAQGDNTTAGLMALLAGIFYVLLFDSIQQQVRQQISDQLQFVQKALQELVDTLNQAARRAAKGGDA